MNKEIKIKKKDMMIIIGFSEYEWCIKVGVAVIYRQRIKRVDELKKYIYIQCMCVYVTLSVAWSPVVLPCLMTFFFFLF